MFFSKKIFITGGLGNQMFQYAFFLSFKEKGIKTKINTFSYTNSTIHNGLELERVFDIKVPPKENKIAYLWHKFIYKFCPKGIVYKDKIMTFNPRVYETKCLYLRGYWMNEEYFKSIEELIRTTFTFHHIDNENYLLANIIRNNNSISIHIRRGDYLLNSIYNVCDENYYRKAINLMCEKVNNPIFYVFSDDPEWCANFITRFNINYQIINSNQGKNSYKDMYLISNCNHNIIANSSFSWWGAWLNKNKSKIVIAPSRWWTNSKKNIWVKDWHYIS